MSLNGFMLSPFLILFPTYLPQRTKNLNSEYTGDYIFHARVLSGQAVRWHLILVYFPLTVFINIPGKSGE